MFDFDNTYATLPGRFYAKVAPTPVSDPRFLKLNSDLGEKLGLDAKLLERKEGARIFAGNLTPAGAEPIAMAYAGHQFGRFVPQLGDGRAILLGEVVGTDGVRYDIQLKGSGPTPFSRNGDGRAAMGPVLREYIISDAMAALGIPTTRSLAAVSTGERVFRDTILPGAVLTRVAKGLIRVGTFEYFAARRDVSGIRTLADYAIARHYPDASQAKNAYRALLDAVVEAQANLIARWMLVGFIHGVMNTDNMSIAGETIDYGPCAFMDSFHLGTVYSSIDRAGRYAYANQPFIAQWNLAQLAQCLLPLLAEDDGAAIEQAQEAIDAFSNIYQSAWLNGMRAKLGLTEKRAGDLILAEALLTLMADKNLDFTNTFRGLCDLAKPAEKHEPAPVGNISNDLGEWITKWRRRLSEEAANHEAQIATMKSANPAFIPRNHRVEDVLGAALQGNLQPLEELGRVLANPYESQPESADYAKPPRPEQVVQATFCGT